MTSSKRQVDTPASTRAGWYAVVVLMILYVSSYLDRQLITMLVTPIEAQLHISDFEMSLLLGPMFGVCYILFGLAAGSIADTWSRTKLILVGAVAWGIATFSSGFATNFYQLAIARIGVGVGEATLTPAAHAIIADRFPRDRLALPMSVFSLGAAFGGAIALWFGGALIDIVSGSAAISLPILGRLQPWQAVFMLVAIPGTLFAPLVLTIRRAGPGRDIRLPATAQAQDESFVQFCIRQRRVLVPLFTGFAVTLVSNYAIVSWVPTYMAREFKMSAAGIGAVWGTISFAALVGGQIFSAVIVDALYRRGMPDAHVRYLIWALVPTAPLMIAGLLWGNFWIFIVCATIYSFVAYPFLGYAAAGVQLVTPPHFRGRMSGAFLASISLPGLAIGPTSVAALTDFVFHDKQSLGLSLAIVIGICAPLTIIALAIALKPFRSTRHE